MSRWIDADALIDEMSEKHRPNFHEDLKSYHMWIMWYWALKNAPTIDAVSVVQGEWVVTYTDGIKQTECSACGVSFITYDVYGWNYCPWCGARMFAKDINVPNKEGADDE